jgi:hypothetical protein
LRRSRDSAYSHPGFDVTQRGTRAGNHNEASGLGQMPRPAHKLVPIQAESQPQPPATRQWFEEVISKDWCLGVSRVISRENGGALGSTGGPKRASGADHRAAAVLVRQVRAWIQQAPQAQHDETKPPLRHAHSPDYTVSNTSSWRILERSRLLGRASRTFCLCLSRGCSSSGRHVQRKTC